MTARSRLQAVTDYVRESLRIAAVGPGWALALDGITYGVGTLFVASIRTHRAAATEQSGFLNDLSEGWREFRSRSWLCVMIVQFALINAYAIGAFLVLGPFVAERSLGGASAWGLISRPAPSSSRRSPF